MKRLALAIVIALAGNCLLAAEPSRAELQLKQPIPLAGVEGRIDHLAFDPAGERLFVCALGNNSVEILDLRKGERIRSITGLGSPQGIAFVAEFNRLFVANDKHGVLKLYDATSFEPLGELTLEDDADNVRYDEAAKKLYVGFGSGGIAIVNPADGKQIASIKLSGHPEAFELEKNRIFVNVPNSRHVAVIDREQKKVIATWSTGLAFANFPIALDAAHHRLFVGCRMPSKLVVLDTDSGKVVSKIDLSSDCDDLFYDSKRRRVYAICGAGKIDIIEQKDPNSYDTTAEADTSSGVRTGLFVPERDTTYVAVPHSGSHEAEIRVYHVE